MASSSLNRAPLVRVTVGANAGSARADLSTASGIGSGAAGGAIDLGVGAGVGSGAGGAADDCAASAASTAAVIVAWISGEAGGTGSGETWAPALEAPLKQVSARPVSWPLSRSPAPRH